MTRLAIVRQKYNAAGGAERFVSRALDALAVQGRLDVSLLARRWEKIAGVSTFKVDPFYLGNVWRDWSFSRAARALWRREGFDLVQSHERIPGCHIYRAGDGVHARWLDLRRQTLSCAGKWSLKLNPYHHYVCAAERAMFLHPDLRLVICNSHMVKREIQQAFLLDDDRFAVIYNGVDTEAFHPSLQGVYRIAMRAHWDIPAAAPLLLYVGSGFERKGVARALEAIVPHRDLHLIVVGGDKHLPRYKKLAEKLGVSKRVRFAGPQHDVKPFYGMADAFILPTLYDPFPNVCVEALACGLPVFTSLQCGAAELIHDGKNGWVADALSVSTIQIQLGQWLTRREAWPDMAFNARQCAEPLTLTAMAETLLGHYQTLLGSMR